MQCRALKTVDGKNKKHRKQWTGFIVNAIQALTITVTFKQQYRKR